MHSECFCLKYFCRQVILRKPVWIHLSEVQRSSCILISVCLLLRNGKTEQGLYLYREELSLTVHFLSTTVPIQKGRELALSQNGSGSNILCVHSADRGLEVGKTTKNAVQAFLRLVTISLWLSWNPSKRVIRYLTDQSQTFKAADDARCKLWYKPSQRS